MVAIASLLIILSLSILITRIATVALTHTGLSREAARFQARSAFTGVGFTTQESEQVVNHPVRRRILLLLMLLGNVGIISVISTLLLSLMGIEESKSFGMRSVLLITGLLGLWAVASSKWIDRRLSILIEWAFRRYSRLEVHDFAALLHLSGSYRISEIKVKKDEWLAGKRLTEVNLREEGILVLGILRKDETYIGAPTGKTHVYAGDRLVVYGRQATVANLCRRRNDVSGDEQHDSAVETQKAVEQEESRQDPGKDSDTASQSRGHRKA